MAVRGLRKTECMFYSNTLMNEADHGSRRENTYVAIKILKGHSTDMLLKGIILEREALHLLQEPSPNAAHCIQLRSEFDFPGRKGNGTHLCFVTDVYGGDVDSLRTKYGLYNPDSGGKYFPLSLAKRILLHILRGIAHSHACGVIHTDIKLDNILFTSNLSREDLQKWLISDPSRRNPPEKSFESIVQSAVSQPLPMPSLEDVAARSFVLADFGNGKLGEYNGV